MDFLQPLTDLFGINLIAVGTMSAFMYFWIKFLKSQFTALKGLYTTIINLISSGFLVYAYMFKQGTLDVISFVITVILVWTLSAGGHAHVKSKANGGEYSSSAFKVDNGKEK